MPSRLNIFLRTWFINTMGVLAAAYLVRGINYDSWTSLLFASLLLCVFNAVLRPVLLLLSLPLLLLTLGLFTLVINEPTK